MKITTNFAYAAMLLCGLSNAQELTPITTPDSRWINNYIENTWTTEGPSSNVIQSDAFCLSDIGSHSYLPVSDCDAHYVGALRDEAGKAFFIPAGEKKESLVYDFTAKKGDTLKNVLYRTKEGIYQKKDIVVSLVDSIEIYGMTRKRIHFSGDYWVEGIGNTKGFLAENWMKASNYQMELTCMSAMNVSYFPHAQAGECELPKRINKHQVEVTELVYPKNNNNWFNFIFDRRVDQDEIVVLSSQGKIIEPFLSVNPDQIGIDLRNYPPGNYILIMKRENYMSIGKMERI